MARAIITVADKTDLDRLALELDKTLQILSGGETGKFLTDLGISIKPYKATVLLPETGEERFRMPELSSFAAVMANRGQAHIDSLTVRALAPADVVVCNLRPPGPHSGDVGGAALIDAAAGNWRYVTIVVDPRQYQRVIDCLRTEGGVSEKLRRFLAREARNYLASYQHRCSLAIPG